MKRIRSADRRAPLRPSHESSLRIGALSRWRSPPWYRRSAAVLVPAAAGEREAGELPRQFSHQDVVASTVPTNGDINPYGVALVPQHDRRSASQPRARQQLQRTPQNFQGTGTTIVDIAPDGTQRLFAAIDPDRLPGPCPGGMGLTTALQRPSGRLGRRGQPAHD